MRRRLCQGFRGLLASAVLLFIGLSHAGEKEQQARALFKEGVEHLRKGQFETALQRFEAAYDKWRNPKILLNIATTLREFERLPEAGDMYELYIADPNAAPRKLDEVKRVLAEIDASIARLTIEVGIDDAVVTIDGVRLVRGKTVSTKPLFRIVPFAETKTGRWRVRLKPGQRLVRVEADGLISKSQTIALSAGENLTVELKLESEKRVAPPPPVEGTLSHGGQMAIFARADVDGKFRGLVGSVGFGYALGSVAELQIGALVGRYKGFEPAASFYLAEGVFKPVGYVGAPVFFADGLSPGIHGAIGLQVDPSPNTGGFLGVGVATFLDVPEDCESTTLVTSIGLQGRM